MFSDPGSAWGAGEHGKPDAELAAEIDRRLLGDPRALLTRGSQSDNALWRDHRNARLLQLADRTTTITETREPHGYGLAGERFLGQDASLVTSLAHDGLPLVGELGSLSDLLGGALDFNLGLNDSGFAEAAVSLPVTALPDFVRAGVATTAVPSEDVLTLRSTSALLTDTWAPGSESSYRARLDGLVIDEFVQALVFPGTFTFGYFPLFKEGQDGQNPQLETRVYGRSGPIPANAMTRARVRLAVVVVTFLRLSIAPPAPGEAVAPGLTAQWGR